MALDDASRPADDDVLAGLSQEHRLELERRTYVVIGDEVVWVDRERGPRREPMSRLYYIQTPKGVFRVSRITREVVEV